MSNLLISALLAFCPGHDFDHKGQTITNVCQEWMTNCVISEAWPNEPTQKIFDACSNEHRDKIRSGNKIVPSDIEE